MLPSQQHQSRINISDLKAQIVKKLGPERSKQYFYYVNRLLSQKLSKSEFDKYCFRTLGRENLPLHNQLIRSILRNACNAKVPPPIHEKEAPVKSTLKLPKKSPSIEDGHQQAGPSPSLAQGPTHFWSNGDALPISPRKIRSGVRERRARDRLDRPSPLGPNGKIEFVSHHPIIADDRKTKVVIENGELNPCDLQRLVRNNQQVLAEQPKPELDSSLLNVTKRPRTKKSPEHVPISIHSKSSETPAEVVHVEEEVEEAEKCNPTRTAFSAPLGIPFCSASIGGARRSLPKVSSTFASSFESGGLPDIETLRRRMEHIAGAEGLQGISTDSANLLNNGLDSYLKRLIRSCFELVGSRTGHEPTKSTFYKQQPHRKLINGMYPSQQLQMQSSVGPAEGIQGSSTHSPISLLDFKVAMELKPQQLGEDWPLLLEKICLHSYDE